jgi:intracellular septation protein A
MSGQIVASTSTAVATAASATGTVLVEVGKAIGKAIQKNPVGALVVVSIFGLTYLALNSKNSIKIEIQGRD